MYNKGINGKIMIRCYDCQVNDSSAFCIPCFFNGDHKGHKIQIKKTVGKCACGDPDRSKTGVYCSKHNSCLKSLPLVADQIQQNFISKFINVLFDLCFRVYIKDKNNNNKLKKKLGQFLIGICCYCENNNNFVDLVSQALITPLNKMNNIPHFKKFLGYFEKIYKLKHSMLKVNIEKITMDKRFNPGKKFGLDVENNQGFQCKLSTLLYNNKNNDNNNKDMFLPIKSIKIKFGDMLGGNLHNNETKVFSNAEIKIKKIIDFNSDSKPLMNITLLDVLLNVVIKKEHTIYTDDY